MREGSLKTPLSALPKRNVAFGANQSTLNLGVEGETSTRGRQKHRRCEREGEGLISGLREAMATSD